MLAVELRDPRIAMIANEGRKLAGALNTGMRRANTEFVGILLADDLWSENAVATLNDRIIRFPEVDFFHSSRRYIDGEDRWISSVYMSRQHFTVEDFITSTPVKHLLCWRKDKALAFGGMDESLNSVGPDDYDFPWCMAERNAKFMAIEECLYLYRDHREAYRLTTHIPLREHKRQIRKIMEKHGVDESTIRAKIYQAESTYLRQCLYASVSDRRMNRVLPQHLDGFWRETYR